MDASAPADFYTGLVADLYRPLRGSDPNPDDWARLCEAIGPPALELGCGDGDPLLDLRARGLDVEGLDSSADMLDWARNRAAAAGIDVVLHHSTIEAMELRRRYRLIFIAGPTFNLIPDDDTAWHALERIREHLEPDGTAVIPLFVPEPTPAAVLGQPRSTTTEDGSTLRFSMVSEQRDDDARLQVSLLRYERETAAGVEVLERPWLLHWYGQEQFRQLCEEAGLIVAGVRAPAGGRPAADADEFVFRLHRDPAWDRPRTTRPKVGGGAVLAAGMMGLDQAIFGERPKPEIVAEAESDGLDLGDVDLDLDDPASSRIVLRDDPPT